LREQLISATKQELSTGHLDERRSETLVADLLLALGAVEARVVARQHDIGGDRSGVLDRLPRLDSGPRPGEVLERGGGLITVEQLLNLIDDVHLGIVVTTASFSVEACEHAAAQSETCGKETRPHRRRRARATVRRARAERLLASQSL
jgi:hypothetical protein